MYVNTTRPHTTNRMARATAKSRTTSHDDHDDDDGLLRWCSVVTRPLHNVNGRVSCTNSDLSSEVACATVSADIQLSVTLSASCDVSNAPENVSAASSSANSPTASVSAVTAASSPAMDRVSWFIGLVSWLVSDRSPSAAVGLSRCCLTGSSSSDSLSSIVGCRRSLGDGSLICGRSLDGSRLSVVDQSRSSDCEAASRPSLDTTTTSVYTHQHQARRLQLHSPQTAQTSGKASNLNRKWSGILIGISGQIQIQVWMSAGLLPKCCVFIILSASVILPIVVKIGRWVTAWETLINLLKSSIPH